MKYCIATLILLATVCSCQSEYERQMETALEHKSKLLNKIVVDNTEEIEAIAKQISFCAEMSGSKVRFLQDLEDRF